MSCLALPLQNNSNHNRSREDTPNAFNKDHPRLEYPACEGLLSISAELHRGFNSHRMVSSPHHFFPTNLLNAVRTAVTTPVTVNVSPKSQSVTTFGSRVGIERHVTSFLWDEMGGGGGTGRVCVCHV